MAVGTVQYGHRSTNHQSSVPGDVVTEAANDCADGAVSGLRWWMCRPLLLTACPLLGSWRRVAVQQKGGYRNWLFDVLAVR